MREAIIILRTKGHPEIRLFPSATEAKEEFKAIRSGPPSSAVAVEMWTSDSGRMKRQKLNRVKAAPQSKATSEVKEPKSEQQSTGKKPKK